MSVKDIHQKDNVVDYRSTDGGDGRLSPAYNPAATGELWSRLL